MNKEKDKRRWQSNGVLTVLLLVVIALTWVMFSNALHYDQNCDWVGEPLHHIAIEGEYSEEGGPFTTLARNTQFDYIELRDITIRGHFTAELPEGEKLFLKIDQLRASLKVNGQEVFHFEPAEGDGNPTNAIGKLWYTFVSPGISTADEVELNFGNLYRNAYIIQFDELLWHMRTGNERTLLFEGIREDGGLWLLGVSFLFFTMFLLLAALLCAILRIKGALQFLWLGFTSLFSALWFCTLAPSLSLLWPWPVFFNILYAYSIQGIAFFVTLFVAGSVSGKRKQILHCCLGVIMGVLLLDMALQITGVRDLFSAINSFSLLDIIVAVCIIFCLRKESRCGENRAYLRTLLKAMLPLAGFGVLELVNGYLQFSEAAICFGLGIISFVVLEGFYLFRQMKVNMEAEARALRLEKELDQNRITIMLSQIQPHFLYNSLTAIKSLCTADPTQAREAVVSFANYLRGNLDALSTEKPILFAQELEHIETYLKLEKMRFGEELQVVYDIRCRDFTLPVLTVQPLVENAVRYGVTKKEGGGTVTISARETETEIVITVADDGVGIDPAHEKNDGKLHIGIENVRSRLAAQCGGSLVVESIPGRGTNVTVTIPKGEMKYEYYCGR